MAMVLRSIYLDPKLDAALGKRAETEETTKADLMRRYIAEGLRQPASVVAGRHSNGCFTEEEFARDPRSVMDFAASNGRATVLGANGKPKFIIGSPNVGLVDE